MINLFRRKIDRRPAYAAVAAVAVLLAVGGYFVMDYVVRGLVQDLMVAQTVPTGRPLAPSTDAYEADAEQAMRSFITYLVSRSEPVAVGDTMTIGLVDGAQTALLGLRVPAERREQHLRAVTLLDAWRAYLAKGTGDYGRLMSRTQQLTQDCPWLLLNVVR